MNLEYRIIDAIRKLQDLNGNKPVTIEEINSVLKSKITPDAVCNLKGFIIQGICKETGKEGIVFELGPFARDYLKSEICGLWYRLFLFIGAIGGLFFGIIQFFKF